MDEKKAPSLLDRARSAVIAVTAVPLADRLHAGLEAALDPSGSNKIRDGVVAEARSAADLLATATKKPEQIVEQAQAQVAIVEDASAKLQAMAARADTPNPTEINKIVNTAKAAEKALDAQEAALKSAQEAFDKSNPEFSKADAEPNEAKTKEISEVTAIVDAGDKAMAAIAPARQILYDMWVQDCKTVADVIAGKKKPGDIKPPVVHTLMGALDAYSKDKEKFKLDDTQKTTLNTAVVNVSLAIDKDAAVKDRFTFDEAKYNEARAKKAVIERDAAPVTLRPEQAAKVAQKEKLDKAIADVDVEKKKLTVAQGEVEQKRNELVKRVEKDAAAAFDEVQKMITQLGIDAQKSAPAEVLSAEDKRTRQAEVSKSWEEALRKFQDVDPERAQEVTKSLADLTKLLFPEQVDKSGKKQAFSHLNFRSMYDNLAKNIGKSKAGKFVGRAINSVRSRADSIVRKLNGEEVDKAEEVKNEDDASEWFKDMSQESHDLDDKFAVITNSLSDTDRAEYTQRLEILLSIFSEDQNRELETIIEDQKTSTDSLGLYTAKHELISALLTAKKAYVEKAEEIALGLNIVRVERMIADLIAQADVAEEGKELTPQQIKDRYNEVVGVWRDLINKNNTIDTQKYKEINEKIAALEKKLFPKAPIDARKGFSNIPNRIKGIADRIIPNQIAEAIADVIIPNKSLEDIQLDSKATNVERAAVGEAPASASEYAATNQEDVHEKRRLLTRKHSDLLGKANDAYLSLVEPISMTDEFIRRQDESNIYPQAERDRFHALLNECNEAPNYLVAYNERLAQLEAHLVKAEAYAKKSEEIAQRLNAERRASGVPIREISDEDIRSWFIRTDQTIYTATSTYDSAVREINKLSDPELRESFEAQVDALSQDDRFRVEGSDIVTEASKLLAVLNGLKGTPEENLEKYRGVHEQLNALILRIKDYIAAVEAIKDRLIREHSSKKAGAGATGGNTSAEAEGTPKPKEVNTNLDAIAWLNPIKERSREFSGAIQRALDSVRDRSVKVQFAQQLREHELTLDTVPNVNDIYRLFNTFDDRQNKVEFYQQNHERIERMVAAMELYIAKANEIAARLNSPPPAEGGSGSAQGPRREASGNKSEARANTKELQDWLDITRIKVVDIARRSSLMLDSMSSDKREEFKKSDIYTRYKTPYDAAEKIFSDVQFKFNEGTDEFYPTAREFNDARVRVGPLLAECEKNLAAAEAEVERRKTEQSEGDKLADKGEAQRWSTSTRPKLQKLYDMIEEIKTSLSGEALSQYSRSPEAKALNNAVIKFNAINDWAFDNKGAPAITNNMFREVKIAIPELIAQCEGPINTTHENLNLKKKQS